MRQNAGIGGRIRCHDAIDSEGAYRRTDDLDILIFQIGGDFHEHWHEFTMLALKSLPLGKHWSHYLLDSI